MKNEKTATEQTAAAPAAEKVEEVVTTVKANNRGYAFLGRVTGHPDFKSIKCGTRTDTASETVIALGGKEDVGNMLRRGYLHIGKSAKAEVKFTADGIQVILAKPRKMPEAKVAAPAAPAVA